MKSNDSYLNPYLAGFGLGLVLLAAIVLYGKGLGASGAIMRTVVTIEKAVSPEHVNNVSYLAGYGSGNKNPMYHWLVFEVIGVIVGGLVSGVLAGRVRWEVNKGPQISNQKRLGFAVLGGALFGFGARLARGCTSGVALSGGATLALGSWATMLTLFVVAYAMAWVFKKLWI
ncbi:MAG: YeeE/YedE family protein [Bdellovibrionales bacterium]|nr:YeeE/YedE family protein [Bdellovibrionales bacterium]